MKEFNEFKKWINEADTPPMQGVSSPLSSPAVAEPDNVKDPDEVEKGEDTSGEASPLSILSEDKELLCPNCASEDVDYINDFSATSFDQPQYECNSCGHKFYEDEVDDAFGLQEEKFDSIEHEGHFDPDSLLSDREKRKKDKKFQDAIKKEKRSLKTPSWKKELDEEMRNGTCNTCGSADGCLCDYRDEQEIKKKKGEPLTSKKSPFSKIKNESNELNDILRLSGKKILEAKSTRTLENKYNKLVELYDDLVFDANLKKSEMKVAKIPTSLPDSESIETPDGYIPADIESWEQYITDARSKIDALKQFIAQKKLQPKSAIDPVMKRVTAFFIR